jgi:HEAT repeat protein
VPALQEALKSSEARVRLHAAHALGAIGTDAKDALPDLADLLKDKDEGVTAAAAGSLAKLGKMSLPALTEALKSDNAAVRRQAIEAVGKVEGTEAVTVLVDALKSPQADVRQNAVRVLGGLRINDKLVVLSLAEVLKKDEDDQARYQAAYALQLLGAGARPAAPALTQALADKNPQVCQTAFFALSAVQVDPVKAIEEHLKSPDLRLRMNVAVMTLQYIRTDHPEALKILADALQEKDNEVRFRAAISLAQVGRAPGETVAVLTEALKDKNASVRVQAVNALAQLGKQAEKALPALVAALKDSDAGVRRQACWAVGNLQADAKETLTALVGILKDDDAGVRQQALHSLWNRFREEGAPHYIEALKDKDPNVRSTAVYYVSYCRAVNKKYVATFLELAKTDASVNVRQAAAQALTATGEDGLPGLVELLAQKDANIQRTAMYGLQQHGAKAKAAVPALIDIVKGSDVNLRWLAAQTLGAIGPDAKEAIPALTEAANDANQAVKVHAQQALQRIDKK